MIWTGGGGASARTDASRAGGSRLRRPQAAKLVRERGGEPVIPLNPIPKHPNTYDPIANHIRNAVDPSFCRIKNFRHITKRAENIFFAVLITAAAVT